MTCYTGHYSHTISSSVNLPKSWATPIICMRNSRIHFKTRPSVSLSEHFINQKTQRYRRAIALDPSHLTFLQKTQKVDSQNRSHEPRNEETCHCHFKMAECLAGYHQCKLQGASLSCLCTGRLNWVPWRISLDPFDNRDGILATLLQGLPKAFLQKSLAAFSRKLRRGSSWHLGFAKIML